MPDIPTKALEKRADELLSIMIDKVKYAQGKIDPEINSHMKRILVCNNACWAIGEMANLVPDKVRP